MIYPTQPLQRSERSFSVDILKGWALFGVVIANYSSFFNLTKDWSVYKPDQLTSVLSEILSHVIYARSWTLLALLFGLGIGVLIQRMTVGSVIRRSLWLLMFGLINSLLFMGDILKDYAVLALLLLCFHRVGTRTLLKVSIFFFVLSMFVGPLLSYLNLFNTQTTKGLLPLLRSNDLLDLIFFNVQMNYYFQVISPFYLYSVHVGMFAFMLLGMWINRSSSLSLFTDKKKVRKIFWISLSVSILLFTYRKLTTELNWTTYKYFSTYYIYALSCLSFLSSGLLWIYLNGHCKNLFNGFASAGRMVFTHYIIQNILSIFLFSGVGLGAWIEKWPFYAYLLIAIGVYIIQMQISLLWLKHYEYGPIEWLWRKLTYAAPVPLRKRKLYVSKKEMATIEE